MDALTENNCGKPAAPGQARILRGIEVAWAAGARVTPHGGLAYFARLLDETGMLAEFLSPPTLAYTSPNAPRPADVMGTLLLSVLCGHRRYAHISEIRNDPAGAELLGLGRVVSEDSVRRALARGTEEAWDAWLCGMERAACWELLDTPYALDIDNTVKDIYGRQEGAELGYHPAKPGRPSHNYHTYVVGMARLVLGVEVEPGGRHAAKCGMPGLLRLLDRLPPGRRPALVRGDAGYGNEAVMDALESRGQRYLFKIRRSGRAVSAFRRLCLAGAWTPAGDGCETCEAVLRLSGWGRGRRVFFVRRPAPARRPAKGPRPGLEQLELFDASGLGGAPARGWEMSILTTDDAGVDGPAAVGLYLQRADCENVFDETKNQWGWQGFVTRDLARSRIAARIIALVYNWWSVFARLADGDAHREAVTSRPMLLSMVGVVTESGRRRTIHLTSAHAAAPAIQKALTAVEGFLEWLGKATAEQLGGLPRWKVVLLAAFRKLLARRGGYIPPEMPPGFDVMLA